MYAQLRINRPQALTAVIFGLAVLAALGPHLAVFALEAAGAQPPAALLLLCPLHQLAAQHAAASFHLHAPALTAPPRS